MTSKIRKSWEEPRKGQWDPENIHSPEGIRQLKHTLKHGLFSLYSGVARAMWRYEGMADDPRFHSMLEMSRDATPENFLFRNGECVWFEYGGTIQCLPYVMDAEGVNIYGNPIGWSPVPVGWTEERRGVSVVADEIRDMHLTWEDSVLMYNDLAHDSESRYIAELIDELVDNTLTMNQLQLLAKAPFVFEVSEDNRLSAQNFFQALSNDSPGIFVNRYGEKIQPVTVQTGVKIDSALFELYDRFECQLLEYIGFPCVPITKRAQQSVSEVESHEMKIYMRRQEKLLQRERAVERLNRMFGTDVRVVSVVDERKDFIFQLDDKSPGADIKTDN